MLKIVWKTEEIQDAAVLRTGQEKDASKVLGLSQLKEMPIYKDHLLLSCSFR
jgi:hypothetical protein